MTAPISTADLIADLRRMYPNAPTVLCAADRLAALDAEVAALTLERNRFERLWEQAMAVGYQAVARSEHQGEHR